MQKIKQHQEKSWTHLFRMRALRLMEGSKQERRKTEKKRRTLQKPAGNSLFLSKHVADTDLSQSQHLLPTRRVSPRQGWVSLAQEHRELTWHDGRKWEELLKAPVSKTGRKLVPLMKNLFILTYVQTCRFFFSAERHLFQHEKWEKKSDSGHLTHMVVSAEANGGLHMASLETWGSLTLWHWIITILWS